jgi:AraC-like DNA-binding protein
MDNDFFIPITLPVKTMVHSFWQTERNTNFKTETIIPQGVVEIIFNFTDDEKIEAQLGNNNYKLAKCFINGFNTLPVNIYLPQKQNFFGVRFHPVAIKNIFGIPPGEFANLTVDLTLIDASINSLWHQLYEQKTFDRRIKIFSMWLQKFYIQQTGRDEMLNQFLSTTNYYVPSVTQLSKTLCYSSRHLMRKLYALTGMNTEELLLYKKFLLSVHLVHYSNLSLTQIAYNSQFADQSHFIKTFKHYSQITPGEYRKFKTHIENHIFKDVR